MNGSSRVDVEGGVAPASEQAEITAEAGRWEGPLSQIELGHRKPAPSLPCLHIQVCVQNSSDPAPPTGSLIFPRRPPHGLLTHYLQNKILDAFFSKMGFHSVLLISANDVTHYSSYCLNQEVKLNNQPRSCPLPHLQLSNPPSLYALPP